MIVRMWPEKPQTTVSGYFPDLYRGLVWTQRVQMNALERVNGAIDLCGLVSVAIDQGQGSR